MTPGSLNQSRGTRLTLCIKGGKDQDGVGLPRSSLAHLFLGVCVFLFLVVCLIRVFFGKKNKKQNTDLVWINSPCGDGDSRMTFLE